VFFLTIPIFILDPETIPADFPPYITMVTHPSILLIEDSPASASCFAWL
jgi:hypothetical protein